MDRHHRQRVMGIGADLIFVFAVSRHVFVGNQRLAQLSSASVIGNTMRLTRKEEATGVSREVASAQNASHDVLRPA